MREGGIVVEKLVGDERWTIEFMFQRRRFHRVMGLSSQGWTRKKCEERIDQIRAEHRHGITSLPEGRRTPLLFSELADWYLGEMERGGGKNLAAKRLHIQRKLKPAFGRLVVEQLAEADVEVFTTSQVAARTSRSTVNRYLATLSHILATAVRRRKIARLPCRTPRLQEPPGRITTLSSEDIQRLADAAARDANTDLWLFVVFGLNTAMRASEITSARFEHIDWEKRRLFIPRAKAGGRHQPITPHLASVLLKERESRSDKRGWIFPSSASKSGHVSQFNEPFRRAATAAGLDPRLVTPHVMRHTAITLLIEAGTPLPTVQRISGHKTIAMVLRYTHVSDRHVDTAMDSLNAITRVQNAS